MTWTRLSDDHFDREEILALSRSAALLNIEATVWCNRLGTDGHVPASRWGRFTTSKDAETDVAELVAAGVWEVDGNGWQVDWTDQETATKVTARQEVNARKQQAYRDRKVAHAQGDHSTCHPRFCPSLQGVTGLASGCVTGDALRSVTGPLPDPVRPVPARPVPKGQGTGTGGSAHAATPSARRELDPPGQEETVVSTICAHGRLNGDICCPECTDAARPAI